MTEEQENRALIQLQRIEDKIDRLAVDVDEIKHLVSRIDAHFDTLVDRLERMEDRIQRIEKQLDFGTLH